MKIVANCSLICIIDALDLQSSHYAFSLALYFLIFHAFAEIKCSSGSITSLVAFCLSADTYSTDFLSTGKRNADKITTPEVPLQGRILGHDRQARCRST